MLKKSKKAHKTLLENVKSLKKGQHIGKVVRDEPKTARNEFELLKKAEATVVDPKVGVQDLLKVLKHSSKHHSVGKQIRNVQASKQPLKRPLEKNVRSAIQRQIAYEGVKKRLTRWDAYVAEHRSAESQIFPLNDETIFVNTKSEKPLGTALKSDLMLEMEATEAKLRVLKGADAYDKETLNFNGDSGGNTREEILERSRRLAYLRMRESQQSAKARLRNKIKSLKYRKLMRRQKMQEEMKKFELMKQLNPELALEKLRQLDKARIVERASLRHKNTGTWAKNLQVRSKFDNEARKDLQEQLQNSRKLTEKIDQTAEGSDTDNDADNDVDDGEYDPFNPWMKASGAESNEKTFENENWRKYWLTRNMNDQLVAKHKAEISELKREKAEKNENDESGECDKFSQQTKVTAAKSDGNSVNFMVKKEAKNINSRAGIWLEENLQPEDNKTVKQVSEVIDTIFDAQEEKINNLLQKKLTNIEKRAKKWEEKKQAAGKRQMKSKTKKTRYTLEDLSFNKSVTKPVIDEELGYGSGDDQRVLKSADMEADKSATADATPKDIDPNNVVTVKQHKGINFDLGTDTSHEDYHLTLCEAFKDDDIVADFTREIEEERKPVENQIELTMPGWGSWSGAGITSKPANNKRITFKLPTENKRRPENVDFVHVNENVSKPLREHLVVDVPFPFTDLDTYNASLRAPIGRNVVPETAFRLLTKPALVTRKGQIIKPAHESELIKQKNKRKFR